MFKFGNVHNGSIPQHITTYKLIVMTFLTCIAI